MRDSDILGKFNIDAQPLVDVRGEELKAAYQRIDELANALKAILAANDDFRDQMPLEWEGDLLQDACDEARLILPLEPFPTGASA